MSKRTCLSITGATSLILGVAAGASGLTLSSTGTVWPGVGMMIACAALMYVAQGAFGRMRAEVKTEQGGTEWTKKQPAKRGNG